MLWRQERAKDTSSETQDSEERTALKAATLYWVLIHRTMAEAASS